jgi:hemerythrin-like domain-containing protein
VTCFARAAAAKERPAEVSPTEDLMREHGILRRVNLLYREGLRRLQSGNPPPAETFSAAAGIIRRFIEGYHEKLEEQQVFPRMERSKVQVQLVQVLVSQHAAGRKLTSTVLEAATPAGLASADRRSVLVNAIDQFLRMYEPHAAREDTILFPAFQNLFSEKAFAELGDEFEEQEHKLLGGGSFEGTLKEVEQLEKSLGIYDLSQFTPR